MFLMNLNKKVLLPKIASYAIQCRQKCTKLFKGKV